MNVPAYSILVVDDDPDDLLIVDELLAGVDLWTPRVVTASTYEEGVRHVDAGGFDIALVDYRLGARRGDEFLAEDAVRRSGLPVVILTGQTGPEADVAAARAGAADFLAKGELSSAILERVIRYTVEDRRRHRMEARFRALIENSRDLITVFGADGSVEYVSPSLIRLIGFQPHGGAGPADVGTVHPEDVDRVRAEFARLAGGESPIHFQYRIADRSDAWHHLDAVGQNLLDDPLVRGIVVTSWDVTELRHIREQTRFQSELLHRVGQPVLAVDDQNRITYWNDAVAQLTGYSAAETMGSSILDRIVVPEDRDTALSARQAATEGRRWEGELGVVRKDGGHSLVHAVVTPAINPDGSPGGRIVVGADVTELRQLEDQRQRASERLRFQANLLSAVGQAVVAMDLDGRITYWNRAAEELYGWGTDEVVGRPLLEVTPISDDPARGREILDALRNGRNWHGEIQVRRRDGSDLTLLVTDAPILDEDGSLIGIIGVASDISGHRALEDQLRQAQKMEAIGRLAGGVAHDFNNLLTAIEGHSGMLLADLPPDSPHREDVSQIHQAGERAAALTRQLLAFSRKQVLEIRAIDLFNAARAMEPMLRRLIPERIAFSVTSTGGRSIVSADPGQLNQIMMNLVVNAADAIPGAGSIRLCVDTIELSEQDAAEIPWHAQPGRYARLTVSDTGTGIPSDVVDHIFDPFFTTKPEGVGTGLGLSTVYGIVKQSAGHIMVDSDAGEGTTFRVLLPHSAHEPDPIALTHRTPAAATGGSAVILLVEDDPAVRVLSVRVLERAGYRVLQAVNGRDALELADRHRGGIDLVLSDVIMPEIGGVELADRLREHYPGLRVILTSGYSEAELRGDVRHRGSAFLVKPFTPDALLNIIAETLAATPEVPQRR